MPAITSAAQCPHPATSPTHAPRPTSPSTPNPTSSSFINVALVNVCSINNKCNDILDIIIDKNIHVFCLTETWLKEGQSSLITSFVPDTHTFHHIPRPKGRGGGVGIVISKNFDNVKAFNRFNDQFESIELHATYQKTKMVFNVIYRPPNGKVADFIPIFEKHILELEEKEKKCNLFR